ncbi:MAG TPA: hypothetical protein PLQ39_07490 [Acinetobacter sp.]|nr:hypothetical protein [Acinetobacter sp.]
MISNKPVLLEQLRSDFEVAKSLGSPLLQCSGMIVIDKISGANGADMSQFLGSRLLIQSAPRPMVSSLDPAEVHYAGGFIGNRPSIPNTRYTGSITMIETEEGSVQALAEFIANNGGAIDYTYYDGRLGYFHRAYQVLNAAIRFESSEFNADSKSNIMTVTCPVDYNYFGLYADIGENGTVLQGGRSSANDSNWHKAVKKAVSDTKTALNAISGIAGGVAALGGLFG